MNRIQAEYKRKKGRSLVILLLIVLLFAIWAAMVHFEFFTSLSNQKITRAMFATLAVLVIYQIFDWRCPNCDRSFGRETSPKFCSGCGVRLKK
ncbi:MAG: hypothetical protein AAF391_04495 [Bacteroidota bacterium]